LTTDRHLIWENFKFQFMQGVIRSTSCLVLGWGFQGQWIEWRYFQFHQIKDGGAAILENSNGDISAADHPIHSMFGARVGLLGSSDRTALFQVGPNTIGMTCVPYVGENDARGVIRLVTI